MTCVVQQLHYFQVFETVCRGGQELAVLLEIPETVVAAPTHFQKADPAICQQMLQNIKKRNSTLQIDR